MFSKKGKKYDKVDEPTEAAIDAASGNSCEAVRAHQEAVYAGIAHMIRTVGDKDDPGVAAISCVITKSGEFAFFMHGALTLEVATTAAAILGGRVLEHTLGKRGKTSPMTQIHTGVGFLGGNEQYRSGVTK